MEIDIKYLKNLASKIIWILSEYRAQHECETDAQLYAIKYFSAVAVDDWPDSDAIHFPKELENLIVYPFLDLQFAYLDEFIHITNGDSANIKTAQYEAFKNLARMSTKKHFISWGLRSGHLSYAAGLINKAIGNKFIVR